MKQCVLIIMLMSLSWAAAQQLSLTAALPLAIPADASIRLFPAPGARAVAYQRAVRLNGHRDYYLCILEPPQDPQCSLIPQQSPSGFEPDPSSPYLPLSWSPDGRYIAVIGQPLLSQTDTDLLIYDRLTESWHNLTDDGYEGALPAAVMLETQVAWSPDGTRLVAEQILSDAEGVLSSSLVIFDGVSGEKQRLTLPLQASSVMGLAWSPDGSSIAVNLLQADADASGLWLIDVATDTAQQLARARSIETAFQCIYAAMPLNLLGPLSWSSDGSRLLFWAGNKDKKPPAVWTFVADSQGQITALSLPSLASDKPDRRTLRPIQASWSPDYQSILILSPGRDRDMPENPLDPENPEARMSLYLIDVLSNTSVLVGHLPLTASVGLYPAAWGIAGELVINGYALQLDP